MRNCSYIQTAISLAAVSHVPQTWKQESNFFFFCSYQRKKSVIVSMIPASWVTFHVIHVLWQNVVYYLMQGSTNFLNI